MNYILGAGVAGIAAAYYLDDFSVIDPKPLGQLNTPFIPGPRLIQHNKYTEKFVKSLFGDNYEIKEAKIGFEHLGTVSENANSIFREKYSLMTRDKDSSESSYLSEGKTRIKHIVICEYGEDSYSELMKRALSIVKDRGQLISSKIFDIDYSKNIIYTGDGVIKYEKIINSLSLKILKKMPIISVLLKNVLLENTTKCFYQCSYGSEIDRNITDLYDYIYSVSGLYSRRTHFSEYIVYESKEPIEITNNKIEGNVVMRSIENLPIQIKNSLCLENIEDIILLGRYAEWNHKVKLDQVLTKVNSISEKLYSNGR